MRAGRDTDDVSSLCLVRKASLTAASGCTSDLEVSGLRLAVRVKCVDLDAFHPDSTVNHPGRLLVVPFGQLRRNRRQITKQSSRAMVLHGLEVHLCCRRGCGIAVGRAYISRAECPDAIDGQGLLAGILQQSVKFPGSQVVGGDEATGLRVAGSRELPDEQVVAEASEIERSQSHAPRSIQPITVLHTYQQAP